MNLCGLMRVESINGKKYILVIVDDYSRYTWTHFLRSKDKTSVVLIDFLKMIQQSFQALVINVQTNKGDRVGTQSKVLDEQHLMMIGAYEGTGTIPGVPNVPKYESKSKKESWGDSGEEDENDYEDKSKGNNDDDTNDDDNQEGDDMNDDDEETNSDSTESDRINIPVLNQSSTEYYEEEEENIDDDETMDEEEDDEVTNELYDDVNVNLGNKDTDMTNDDQADNEITSLIETSARYTTIVPEVTSGFTTNIPPPPLIFNPHPQQATPTLTP
nr:ribonuclease H-like domain-containing protein [Tanacetum cinerariifolium]